MKHSYMTAFLTGLFVGLLACVTGLFLQWQLSPEQRKSVPPGYIPDSQAKAQAAIVARRSFDQGVQAGAEAITILFRSNTVPNERLENLYSIAYDRNPVYDPRKK